MTDVSAERLYGLPDAEDLYVDAATCYETDIEPYLPWADQTEANAAYEGGLHEPDPPEDMTNQTRVIEEWSVHPPRYHLPPMERLIEFCEEWAYVHTGAEDGWLVKQDAEVWAAVDNALDVIATKITYRMAKDRVAEHVVTWDADGRPLLDGEPLYR